MKRKFKLWLLLAIGLLLTVGVDSCKKEDDQKNALWWLHNGSDLSYEEEEEDPDAIRAEAEKSYQEAFDAIKQNKNYDLAVEKLTKAAKANVDSSNMFLAYMYEYGVGVKQDIEKAKEYYARETAINGNEFAVEKLASLNDKGNNYQIVLPEGCNINLNSLAVMYEDVVTIANGNGTFNSTSNIVQAKNSDNKFVTLGYRHPSVTGKIELNSTETALTLLLGTIPYGFHLNDNLYNQARSMLLQLDETRQMANEIDNQLKKQGYFELSSLVPYMSKVYNYMYSKYGTSNRTKSVSKSTKEGVYAVEKYKIDDGNGNSITIAKGSKENDVETQFKSGSYNVKTKTWNVSLTTTNYSSCCIKVVPGTIDPNSNVFIPKYSDYDEIRFIKASKAMDLGGGTVSGLINTVLNYYPIIWTTCQKYASVDSDPYSFNSPINDFYEAYAMMGDILREYRYEYTKEETELNVEIRSNNDAIKYVFPNEDFTIGGYYVLYYAAIPILNIQQSQGGKKVDEKTIRKVAKKALDKTILDESWVNGLNQFVYRREYNVSDKYAREFYIKSVSAVYDAAFVDDEYVKTVKPMKIVSSSNKILTKLSEGKDAGIDAAKFGESYVDKQNLGDLDNILKALEGAENLITYLNGIADMIGAGIQGEYLSFDVRFNMVMVPLTIKCTPETKVAHGYSRNIYATCNRNCNIIMYVNDKEVKSVSDASSLSYDLSQLPLGSYKIKFKAYEGTDIAETEEFTCTVTSGNDGTSTVQDLDGENL